MKKIILLFFVLAAGLWADVKENPVEIGWVNWGRDLPFALNKSIESRKPIYLLFKEVPGCSGCQDFGKTVLRHPLIIEAVEDEFIPVFVYNNTQNQKDLAILQKYNEPAWNFQVVRFLDSKGRDIIPREDRVNTVGAMSTRMIRALEEYGREVPKYLYALEQDYQAERADKVALSQHCFWSGEYEIGQMEGVLTTEAGWLDGREVTLVTYDREKLSEQNLFGHAKAQGVGDKLYSGEHLSDYRKAQESDQKKQLERLKGIKVLPGITQFQLTKVNALFPHNRKEAFSWLSPRQLKKLGFQYQNSIGLRN